MEWKLRPIEALVADGTLTLVEGYAEPGYFPIDARVYMANWNDEGLDRVGTLLEHLGHRTEWSDEWEVCEVCRRAVRVQPDSYSWLPSYTRLEGDTHCLDCVLGSEELSTEWLSDVQGEVSRALIYHDERVLDLLESEGFVKVNEDAAFENGLHGGQDDDPSAIARTLQGAGVLGYIFLIEGVGQFDRDFSVYVPASDLDDARRALAAPRASKAAVDPAEALKRGLQQAGASGDEVRRAHAGEQGVVLSTIDPQTGDVVSRWVTEDEFIRGLGVEPLTPEEKRKEGLLDDED
jgi:hypothetical protein